MKFCSFLILLFVALTVASEPIELEQLHLDPIEKALVEDSKMPAEKVKMLLDAEVSLTEYFRYPWLQLGISEKEWIRQQRAGIIGSDTLISTKQIKRTEWAVVQNFFVPGLHEFKRKQTAKGFAMSGIALSSIVLFTFHKRKTTSETFAFDYPVYLVILGADMMWSSIDIGVQINRELNKDAMRFSYSATIPIKFNN